MKKWLEKLEEVEVIKEFLDFWRALDRRRRIQIILSLLLFVAIVVILVWVTVSPKYEVLYTNLDPEEASAIVSYLEENKIPYKLKDGGRTILVPEEYVDRVRIDLASKGITASFSDAYAIFDQTRSMFLSAEQERIFEQRALEIKLRDMLRKIQGIQDVRVSVVLPSRTIFAEQVTGTARVSVVVEPKYGARLTDETVRAIVNLCVGAVPGLTPDNVVVADTSGRVLWFGGSSTLASNMIDYKFNLEQKLAFGIETKLMQQLMVLGLTPDVVDVKVNLDVDVSKVKKVSEDYGDTSTLSLSEKHEKEVSSGSGGVVGTAGNVAGAGPTYPYGTAGTSSRTYDERTVNYEVDKVVTTFEDNGGHIQNVSVSVVIDTDALKNLKLSAQKIEELVRTYLKGLGVGENGEHVVVVPAPLAKFKASLNPEVPMWKEILAQYGLPLGVLLLMFILSLVLLFVGRPKPEPLPDPKQVVEEILREKGLIEELEAPPMTPEDKREKELMDKIREIIMSQPDKVAAIVKMWLEEEV